MKTPSQGKITISRYTGGKKGTGITISVVDEMSGIEFMEIEITAETLGNALTGLSFLPCEFELRAENVGKKREIKTERIKFQLRGAKGENEMARVALIPYEVDGWRGYADDLLNHHHRNQDGTFNVSFTRFVDAPK